MDTLVIPLCYSLDSRRHLPWTATQEKAISHEYAYESIDPMELADQLVSRTYLQFLWLPESIMPLNLVVPSLRRVNLASSSSPDAIHPLHAHLETLLHTSRSASTKYNLELPQILRDGGGAGEIEENMMWYSVGCEKNDSSDQEEPWRDEAWRSRWLERLECREIQIQILLYFLKLSLPGPPPAPPTESPKKKKSRKRKPELKAKVPSVGAKLEAFMDKLSMKQLMGDLDNNSSRVTHLTVANARAETGRRDWIQAFFEDIVEAEFKSSLPTQCALFRSKVFPNSPFEDIERERSPSPFSAQLEDVDQIPFDANSTSFESMAMDVDLPGFASSNAPSTSSRSPSLARDRSISREPSMSRFPSIKRERSESISLDDFPPPPRAASRSRGDDLALSRSRSRSLSVSLAQERASSKGPAPPPKRRALNREVSMSRSFKGKSKTGPAPANERAKTKAATAAAAALEKAAAEKAARNVAASHGNTLVENTPAKPKLAKAASYKTFSTLGSSVRIGAPNFVGAVELGGLPGRLDMVDDDFEDFLEGKEMVLGSAIRKAKGTVLAAGTPRKGRGRPLA